MIKKITHSAKFMIITMFVSCMTYAAFKEARFKSLAFMDKDNISFDLPDGELPRTVASRGRSSVAILYYPFSHKNAAYMNTKWNVYRFTNAQGFSESIDKVISLKLIGNSKVAIAGDYNQIFRISYLTEQGTLALVKRVHKGYEVIELRKYNKVAKSVKTKNTKSWSKYRASENSQESVDEKILDESRPLSLVVERAYNPTLNKQVLKGDFVEGGLVRSGKNRFSDLSVSVNFGPGKSISFDIPSLNLKNGGQFQAELDGQQVTGIVTSSGVEGYRVRIASGRYAGTVLNFVSEDEMENLRSQEEQRQMQADLQGVENNEYQTREKLEYEQNKNATQRGEESSAIREGQEEEKLELLEEDVVSAKIQEAGFSFGLQTMGRSIASEKKGSL